MMALIRLKMAVFAPMPSAKEITAMAVKPGLFCIKRNANRTSCEIMVAFCASPKRQSTILEAAHVEVVLQEFADAPSSLGLRLVGHHLEIEPLNAHELFMLCIGDCARQPLTHHNNNIL